LYPAAQIGDNRTLFSREPRGKDCDVTETIPPHRTAWTRPRWIGLMVLIAIVSLLIGFGLGYHGYTGLQNVNKNYQKDNEKLTAEKIALQNKTFELENQLKVAQEKIASFSSNVYEIKPNQSQSVPRGNFIIGFVGTPGNQKVDLQINDKQYSVAAGEVINIQQSLNCRIEVMSFDVIEARVKIKVTCLEAQH
jgi:hypothetical protein